MKSTERKVVEQHLDGLVSERNAAKRLGIKRSEFLTLIKIYARELYGKNS